MKKIMSLLAVSMLAGCSTMMVAQSNIKTKDGSMAYYLTSKYGGIDGNKKMAQATLANYSKTLCRSGYTKISETEMPSPSTAGWKGYMTDVVWEIKCNNPQPSS